MITLAGIPLTQTSKGFSCHCKLSIPAQVESPEEVAILAVGVNYIMAVA